MVPSQFNTRSAGVKRLMKEAMEMKDPTDMYAAQPFEDNLFEWHFTVRGPQDSDFEGGIYHGRIVFPSEYPMKPPNLIVLTPNGRFELNKKICLSISGYHPETWLPSWSVRTALLALIGFMPTEAAGAIGGLSYPASERQILAKKSVSWVCKDCGLCMKDALKPFTVDGAEACTSEAMQLVRKPDESAEKPSAPNEEAPISAASADGTSTVRLAESPNVSSSSAQRSNVSRTPFYAIPYLTFMFILVCLFGFFAVRRFASK